MIEPGAVSAGADELSDQTFLERFASRKEEEAFAELVRRHGPLVLGVCRRVLRHEQDAEDAFQAVFCALARRAGSIRKGAALGGWLHTVAYRIAARVRSGRTRRPMPVTELPDIPAPEGSAERVWQELRPILDEEVNRLPEKYRQVFVLCHLEGQTNQQAANQLGCPLGTVLSRLKRARERLRARMTRRGLALSVAALTAAVVPQAVAATVPPALAGTTVQAAATGAFAPAVAALTNWYLRSLLRAKLLRIGALLALLLALGGLGLFVLLRPAVALNDSERLQGRWNVGLVGNPAMGMAPPGVGFQMLFQGDICTFVTPMGQVTARFTLDPSRTPKEITLTTGMGVTWPGIYEFDRDTLRICLNQQGPERPKDFAMAPGALFFLYEMKRPPGWR